MKLPSQMTHKFSEVPSAEIQRSIFDRKAAYKSTFMANKIVPYFVDEVLPGDTFNFESTIFVRLATPIVPIMDNLYLDTFYFFVPNRIIWTNFVKMMGEEDDPGDVNTQQAPIITVNTGVGIAAESLFDYMGIPIGIDDFSFVNLHGRAYNLIYNEFFRDQNLENSTDQVVDKDDGPDLLTDYVLLTRNKRHDYFTSCLPWPQKADTAVTLPLGTSAPVYGIGMDNQVYDQTNPAIYETDGAGTRTYAKGKYDGLWMMEEDPDNTGFPNVRVDLANATAATINQIREAFQKQKVHERDARGGTRYTEMVRSHFGVVSPDARLQRPEFLGGNTTPIIVNPIAQLSQTATTELGTLSGIGTALANREGFTKSFTEHGVILGLLSVRADLTYQQGLHKMWSRRDRFDYYIPALANIGEQGVEMREIYLQPDAQDTGATGTPDNDRIFGYQERWSEYRYLKSLVTGKFNSNHGTPLDYWHLAQDFASSPTLSKTFIQEATPMSRVLAVTDESDFYMDAFITCRTVRPMPVFSVPGMLDHF